MNQRRKTAIYIRLSIEDRDVDGNSKTESDSVSAQRILLRSFAVNRLGKGELELLEYVDDGVSGTRFDRQGFQKLLEDMKAGLIGCIIVKDFSRFGRDYLEVGYYMEYIFPLLQIRFVSVNDSYDSAESAGMTGGMNIALKNLINNMYSLDLSKKIKSAMDTRSKNGTRLPVKARYGYRKGKDGRLEKDPEAAEVVKMVFELAAEGDSFAEIARKLNLRGVPSIEEYKRCLGEKSNVRMFDTVKKSRWSPSSVAGIVRDELYIGVRIWGKTRCSMHTNHKAVAVDEKDWYRLENEHEAIIGRELFDKANQLHPQKAKKRGESRYNYTIPRRKKQPAFLLCGNCGRLMLQETKHLLKCSDGRTSGDPLCRAMVVRREPLEESILKSVHQYAELVLEKRSALRKETAQKEPEDISALNQKASGISIQKVKLYDDYKNGEISLEAYKEMSGSLQKELEELKRRIQEAAHQQEEKRQDAGGSDAEWQSIAALDSFDTETLRKVIKAVWIYGQYEVEIEWLFDDPFKKE